MENFIKLGLQEACGIVKTLGISPDVMYLHGNVEVNGKLHIYEKKGDQLTITGEDGKSLTVKIGYSEEVKKDYQNRDYVAPKHEVTLDYKVEDGHHLTFHRVFTSDGIHESLPRGYASFEDVNRDNLLSGTETTYVGVNGEKIATFTTELYDVCPIGETKSYLFSSAGIEHDNKLFTVDGGQLISVHKDPAASLDDAKSFDLEKEKEKIENFLKSGVKLHPFTREMIKDAYRKLDRKERYAKDIIRYYSEEVGKVQDALHLRNEIGKSIDGAISPAAIARVDMAFRKEIIARKQKEREEERGTFKF